MEENTVFENDFDASAEAVAAPENEVVEPAANTVIEQDDVRGDEPTADGPAEADDDFFAENAAPEMPAVDPAKIVTIIPSSSDEKYVETDGNPVPMLDLISRARLQFEGEFHCYLNNAEISLTTLVPAGSTVSIVGKVKGG